jgi:EpsI family protein
VLVCALLVSSGAIRLWHARRVRETAESGRTSAFPLKELPLTLGNWRGADAILDPRIAQHTGASDAVFRRYVDQATGATVEVIVLYGPAVELFIHTPEVCYSAAGYTQSGVSGRRVVTTRGVAAPFQSLVFEKGQGGDADILEVYYSWRHQGHWTPELGMMKQIERIPGMYKVQLARRLTVHERRDVDNPCESLLEFLVPEIERRLTPAS